jgi:hypothetical protein
MSKFMVRVALHDAEADDHYQRLDAAMQDLGFSKELSGKRSVHLLPRGDYWYRGHATAPEVRVMAAAAAESTGRAFGIIAIKVDGWSVMGLRKSTAPAGE